MKKTKPLDTERPLRAFDVVAGADYRTKGYSTSDGGGGQNAKTCKDIVQRSLLCGGSPVKTPDAHELQRTRRNDQQTQDEDR